MSSSSFTERPEPTGTSPIFWNPNNPNHRTVRPGSLGLLEARDSHSPSGSRPPTERLVEVRDAGHMGFGLFAKEAIPRGTRILAELPLIAMPATTPLLDPELSNDDQDSSSAASHRRECQDIVDFIDRIVPRGISHQDTQEMETLHCDATEAHNKDTKDVIHRHLFGTLAQTWRQDRLAFARHFGQAMGQEPPRVFKARAIDRYARLYAIWLNNRIKLGEGASMDTGVFRLASRINHSCCPNAWFNFNPHTHAGPHPVPMPVRAQLGVAQHWRPEPRTVEMLTTHAIRDIAAGEQILVGYEAVSLQLRPERAQKLAECGVHSCGCALCTQPLVEALQRRAYVLWQAADDWARPQALKRKLAERQLAELGCVPCRDAWDALMRAEEVVALLTHPAWNVREMALAEAYKVCSVICERIATDPQSGLSYDEAVQYWQKAMRYCGEKCQVYMILEGTDGREMKRADKRLEELGDRRARWMALQNGWQWSPRP